MKRYLLSACALLTLALVQTKLNAVSANLQALINDFETECIEKLDKQSVLKKADVDACSDKLAKISKGTLQEYPYWLDMEREIENPGYQTGYKISLDLGSRFGAAKRTGNDPEIWRRPLKQVVS